MALRLFLLFTLVPALELFFLVRLGLIVGPWSTIGLVLLTGFVGAWLAKREGFAVLRQLQADLHQGLPPATRLVEGALVLTGAVLLITPGLFTDIAGLLLLFPPTRRWMAPRALRWLVAKVGARVRDTRETSPNGPWTAPASTTPTADRHFDHPVR